MKEGLVMTMTIRKLMLGVVLATVAAAAAAREAPLKDPGKIELAVVNGLVTSPARVRQALVLAGASRGWVVAGDQPGRLKLSFNKGDKHRVTVDVSYDERSFDIRYVDSYNLNYAQRDGQTMIHPNYNRWVNNLAHDTRMIFMQGGAGVLPAAPAPN
jgi:hypothetical protein